MPVHLVVTATVVKEIREEVKVSELIIDFDKSNILYI